jgi:hypothetical protein
MNHYQRFAWSVQAAVALAFICANCPVVSGQPVNTDEILRKWKIANDEFARTTSYSCAVSATMGSKTKSYTLHAIRSGNNLVLEKIESGAIFLKNDKYSCIIKRNEQGAHAYSDIATATDSRIDILDKVINFSTAHGNVISPNTFFLTGRLDKYLESGELVISSSQQVLPNIILKCELTCQNTANNQVRYSIYIYCDSSSLMINKIEFKRISSDGTVAVAGTQLFDYANGKIKTISIQSPGDKDEISFTDFQYAKIPIDRFTATFYGLPEPEGVVWEKPIPSYVWYLSIAGGAVAIMLLCGWLLKRGAKARAAAATTTSAPLPPAKVE